MKKIPLIAFLFILGLQVAHCQKREKETMLDRIVHIEHGIYDTVPYLPRLCDSTASAKQYINIGDTKIYVETEGEGVPIVLINGGPGGTHHYFHPWFSALKKDHKIIYYDQRGTGQSDFKPEDGYTFKQAMEDLEAIRKQMAISKWIVCGYSYGGGLAQYYTLAYPENVSGMVLISALPVFEDKGFKSTQQKYISKTEKEMMRKVIDSAKAAKRRDEFNMSVFLYNLELNGDWKRQSFYKPTKEETIRSALYEWVNDDNFNSVVNNSMKAYNFRGKFDNCPIPTLIYEAKHDLTWGDKKAAIFKANHPNSEYVFFKNSGHGIFKDEPEKFMKQLLQFTKGLKPIPKESIEQWKANRPEFLKKTVVKDENPE